MAAGVWQVLYFEHHNIPTNDQYQYIWFAAWQFYFVLGIFLAIRPIRLISRIGLIAAIAGLIWSIRDTHALLETGKNLIWATRFTRESVLLYSTGVIIWSVSHVKKTALPDFARRFVTFLGIHSYSIYLAHVLFIHLLFH